jgi:hypothetical protein
LYIQHFDSLGKVLGDQEARWERYQLNPEKHKDPAEVQAVIRGNSADLTKYLGRLESLLDSRTPVEVEGEISRDLEGIDRHVRFRNRFEENPPREKAVNAQYEYLMDRLCTRLDACRDDKYWDYDFNELSFLTDRLRGYLTIENSPWSEAVRALENPRPSPAVPDDRDSKPLHLVLSKVGDRMAMVNDEDGNPYFTMMAEIQGRLNFSLNGEFKEASVVKASALAPDGKTYELAAFGEQDPPKPGTFLRKLQIKHGERHADFSIGNWKVSVEFKVDDKVYTHGCDYLVTWRRPEDGGWDNMAWVNDAPDLEEGGKPEAKDGTTNEGK